ncbi:MAG: type I pullulanase [Bacteroidota bacterium]
MTRYFSLLLISLFMYQCAPERPVYGSFSEYPLYTADDLGLTYTAKQATFKLWSPAAAAVKLHLYESDDPATVAARVIEMEEVDGAWTVKIAEDMAGYYYTFQIKMGEEWLPEAADPYARAVGTNGMRTHIIDLAATNPPGWEDDQSPALEHPNDIVLYELHVRDASQHPSSGIQAKGKFVGLTELGTQSPAGLSTGIDHIKELGVTHVHLLPSFDFMSVDESRLDEPQFNWGYDPQNYNVPEGSYSTDPSDGAVRIREFKQLIQTFHANGLRVVMDVVYNHTGRSEDSKFNLLAPDYYYRQNEDGSLSNASGCGNEIASDRPMVRKYIRESIAYWMKEYHIDGFRFDLMGIHDIPTMNEISRTAKEIDPTVFIYGEGWTAGDSPLPDSLRALKAHVPQLKDIAAFSDDIRDGMKGSVFVHEEIGFVSGAKDVDQSIRFGIVGATQHPQIDYRAVNYSDAPWAPEPSQCITYASCHDNHTLWDRLAISNPEAPEAERSAMHRLALAIVLTSQGVPFLHAGSEMQRTKGGEENSYKSPDSVNAIDWSWKETYKITNAYVQGLIQLRKNHPAFRMRSTADIQKHLSFLETEGDQVVAYQIQDAPGEEWKNILVAFNGGTSSKSVVLPAGRWLKVVNDSFVNEGGIGRYQINRVVVPAHSAVVLVHGG